ncbi:MAG: hypothetical protein CM1200mP21_03620 [Candidatus Poseidoniales archaeon]|nr:MAG: hypothetical protein CM1200mP21_03620 [Candidatus Poseidoniales archaeon]
MLGIEGITGGGGIARSSGSSSGSGGAGLGGGMRGGAGLLVMEESQHSLRLLPFLLQFRMVLVLIQAIG